MALLNTFDINLCYSLDMWTELIFEVLVTINFLIQPCDNFKERKIPQILRTYWTLLITTISYLIVRSDMASVKIILNMRFPPVVNVFVLFRCYLPLVKSGVLQFKKEGDFFYPRNLYAKFGFSIRRWKFENLTDRRTVSSGELKLLRNLTK